MRNESSLAWHPVNFTDLFSLCRPHHHPAEKGDGEEKRLASLVERFDQMKSFYPPQQRLSIHRHVVNVLQRCQQQNSSVAILSLLLQLADHAFRQPEVEIELVKEKSVEHRQLEKALRQNKERVLALVSRNLSASSLVTKLRKDAINLTMLLTREIQREMMVEALLGMNKARLICCSTSLF